MKIALRVNFANIYFKSDNEVEIMLINKFYFKNFITAIYFYKIYGYNLIYHF